MDSQLSEEQRYVMSETNKRSCSRRPPKLLQNGTAAVEFALLAILFFTIVFGVLEFARVMYVFGTVQEVTRRGAAEAAVTSHRDTAALNRIRQNSIFRDSPGELLLGWPITDRNVRIDYMALTRQNDGSLSATEIGDGQLPACPRRNREICLADPNAPTCIRLVRVRVCADDGATACTPVNYRTFFPLIPFPVKVPRATTISVVESFGSMPEGTPCL
jgi:hypothetical protein